MASRTQKEQQRKRARQARQKLIGSLVVAAILINAALGYWLYGELVVKVEEQRLEESTRAQANRLAHSLQGYLSTQRQALRELAAANQTRAALEGDAALREAREAQIDSEFKGSLAVRLIPTGTAELEREHVAPLRFAELDLIRRAERRETHHPELSRVEQAWQLHFIEPVPPESDAPVVGTVLVTLDDGGWRPLLDRADPALGRIQLRQQIPGSGQFTAYQRGEAGGEESHSTDIANSYWTLSYTASAQRVANTQQLPTLWLMILSATSIAGLILAWGVGHLILRQRGYTGTTVPARKRSGKKNQTDDVHKDEEMERINTLYRDQDVLDIEVHEEDEDILALDQAPTKRADAASEQAPEAAGPSVPAEVFRSYDIRGLAETQITPELAEQIGKALGSEALDQGETHFLVARDGRTHSPALAEALRQGVTSTGCHVIDLGTIPTPLMYFATFHLEETSSGVIVTASHNPREYNGFKMVINGVTLSDETVLDIRSRIERQQYHQGQGETQSRDIVTDYIERIFSDVALVGSVSLVVDAGNAVPGLVAPRLFEELGCEVTPLYCELDGEFPNHDPDPTQKANLQDLIAKVQEVGADLGAAFDGDGDRLIVVTPQGRIIWPDQLLMLFARDILGRNPGADVLFDVKCSRQLNQLVTSYGGRPIMWKTGHSHMKSKMVETGALIGGEYSGHIFIKDRWYGFDDGLYTLARLLEIITLRDQAIDDIFAAFPDMPCTPELKIPVPDREKFALVERLIAEGDFQSGKATTIDGLRVDFGKGWGLVRASNTSAALTLRFEADSEEALGKIQQLFKRELLKIDSGLKIDF